MAKPEHLKILRQGVEKWNQWRRHNPAIKPNLSRAKLRGADLRGADLNGVYLGGADLDRANLRGASLIGADLSGTSLIGANLREADLSRADLVCARLKNADLRNAKLSGAHLIWGELGNADLREADFYSADLDMAKLLGANLSGANLIDADLRKANLSGTSLKEADLIDADLSEANLNGTNLSEADLSGTNLTEAFLSGANLSNAVLHDANLTNAKCNNVNLTLADLRGARLINTILDGAILTGSWLWETQRAGWSIKGVVCKSVFLDMNLKKPPKFRPGEFERLYAAKPKVLVYYQAGINPLEIATLPALIQHLESSHPGSRLRLESIQNTASGTELTLIIEGGDDISPEELEQLRTTIQSEAEQKTHYLRQALEEQEERTFMLKEEVRALESTVERLLLDHKPNFFFSKGDVNEGDTYNVI